LLNSRSPTNDTGAIFENTNYSNAILYVPFGTKEKCFATDCWKNFANIVEMDKTAVKEVCAIYSNNVKYFSTDGKHLLQPQKGLNIIRMSDGTTRKIVSK